MLTVNSKRAEYIRAELKINHSGVEAKALAQTVGLSAATTVNYLQLLREYGLAVYVNGCPRGGKWCDPKYADAIRAAYDKVRLNTAERKKMRNAVHYARRKAREQAGMVIDIDRPFVRKIVPAHEAERIVPAAPASVFSWRP